MSLKHRMYGISKRLQLRLMPGLRYCQGIYEDVLAEEVRPEVAWLDLGCGWQVLPHWRRQAEVDLVRRARLVVGLDYDLDSLRQHTTIQRLLRGDARMLPFESESFDLITSNMVLEHADDPTALFNEVARVLRPGGSFLFHTPSVYGYATILARLVPERLKARIIKLLDDRDDSDVFEAFYRINSPNAVRSVCNETGLRLVKLKMIVSSPRLRFAPPLALLELVLIRLLMTHRLRRFRPNMIALVRKQSEGAGQAGALPDGR